MVCVSSGCMLTWSPYTSTPSLDKAARILIGLAFSNKLTTTCGGNRNLGFIYKF
jgi:hypothetical protein